jgi:hypothetical protein
MVGMAAATVIARTHRNVVANPFAWPVGVRWSWSWWTSTTLSAAVVVPSLVVLTDVMGAGIRVTLIPNARVLVLLMALSMAGLASQRCSHWLALNGRREHEAQERHDGRET